MPLELMLQLAQSSLPAVLTDQGDIDKVRILVAAELVEAILPDVYEEDQAVHVLSITHQGKAALRKAFPLVSFDPPDLWTQPGSIIPEWLPSLEAKMALSKKSKLKS